MRTQRERHRAEAPHPPVVTADILRPVLGAGLIFLAIIIVVAMVVAGVGIFLRMWNLRRR